MNIQIKSMNDLLIIKCPQDILFSDIISDLSKLLDEPIFYHDRFIPKAFFDFGCRELQDDELKQLINLLLEKKKLLFHGITIKKEASTVEVFYDQVRNGEEVIVSERTLFLGTINEGVHIYCYHDVYFLNDVKGAIYLMDSQVKIYGHYFENAKIIINQGRFHNLTTSAFTSVYYKDNEIVCDEEEYYDKDHCFNFW